MASDPDGRAEATPPKPLAGVRIIDLTVAWAGPMACRILANLGADVIHVEGPGRLDSWRGPIDGGDPRRYPGGEFGQRPYDRNCMFNTQNQGKRAICLDLKHPAGTEVIRRLAAVSDAVVANFTPGTLARLGLDDRCLHEVNPDLVVMEMPAFGLFGPNSSQVALGPTMEAAAGMAAMIGYGDGKPYVTGPAYMDPIGAFNGSAALLTALLAARRGRGPRHVELPQCEMGMHWIGELLATGLDQPSTLQPNAPNAVPYAEPHAAFPCVGEDEWVAIAVQDDRQWADFVDLVQDEYLSARELRSMVSRRRQRAAIHSAISQWTGSRDKGDVAELLQKRGIPAAPVCSGADVAHRRDLLDSGFFEEHTHPAAGTHWYQGLPLRIDGVLLKAERPAPTLGQDNEAIFKGLVGLDDSEYRDLVDAGVIADAPVGPVRPARAAADS